MWYHSVIVEWDNLVIVIGKNLQVLFLPMALFGFDPMSNMFDQYLGNLVRVNFLPDAFYTHQPSFRIFVKCMFFLHIYEAVAATL